jgi:hypothetical protein
VTPEPVAVVAGNPLNFEEHRRRRENASTVRCARCKKWMVATATLSRR